MYEFVSNACQLHIDYVIPENSRKPSGGLMMKTIPLDNAGTPVQGGLVGMAQHSASFESGRWSNGSNES